MLAGALAGAHLRSEGSGEDAANSCRVIAIAERPRLALHKQVAAGVQAGQGTGFQV